METAPKEIKGEWIPSHPVELAKEWKCTNCQELVYTSEFVSHCPYEYCPNCGSKNRKADSQTKSLFGTSKESDQI